MSEQRSTGLVAIVVAPVLVIGLVFSIVLFGSGEAAACTPAQATAVAVDPDTVPTTPIAGYDHEQLVNAANIIAAGAALDMSVRDQTIGVMTAMGESSLRVLDEGDAVGPDSRGLFQQRANGAWGSYEDRMDPYISATNFFNALALVEHRDVLAPTIAAHRVQRNADPFHYERFWSAAVEVVEQLSGANTGLSAATGSCESAAGTVNQDGWGIPSEGPITGRFGPRTPILTPGGWSGEFHRGTDLAPGCEAPIWAVQTGTVIAAGSTTPYPGTGTVVIDHGGGVESRYVHMWDSGIFVNVGDQVSGGEQIAEVGTSGNSTGCHLHFEIFVDGEAVDAEQFMSELGITLGSSQRNPE